MKKQWTEGRIAKMHSEGYGQGSGAAYKPWLEIRDVSSTGRKTKYRSAKCGRDIHTLSDIEYRFSLLLEWSEEVLDFNEQYPLERELTQHVAHDLGVKHPYYPGTDVPTVMTVDFFVTMIRHGKPVFEGFNVKDDGEASNERSMAKLEIQRVTLEAMGCPHHIVLKSMLPMQLVQNLDTLQNALLREGELEPFPGFYQDMHARMRLHLEHSISARPNQALWETCTDFDAQHDVPPGTGLRCARMLLKDRTFACEMAAEPIDTLAMSAFSMREEIAVRAQAGGAR